MKQGKLTLPINVVRPHQLAWLRRPELDTKNEEAWEQPCGNIYFNPKGKYLLIQIIKKNKK